MDTTHNCLGDFDCEAQISTDLDFCEDCTGFHYRATPPADQLYRNYPTGF